MEKATHENILESITKNQEQSKYPVIKNILGGYWNIIWWNVT